MKIIVGIDGSASSKRAVEWCASHAGRLGAEVVAVHVLDVPISFATSMPFEIPVVMPSAADRKHVEDLATREWCAPLAKATVPFRVVVVDGQPAFMLMQAAKGANADLVVTGRRGRGGLAELILGSTSHALSHHLDRPLVIVP